MSHSKSGGSHTIPSRGDCFESGANCCQRAADGNKWMLFGERQKLFAAGRDGMGWDGGLTETSVIGERGRPSVNARTYFCPGASGFGSSADGLFSSDGLTWAGSTVTVMMFDFTTSDLGSFVICADT